MTPTSERERGTVIRMEGAFDLPAARLVAHTLQRMSPGEDVVVDFTHVRQFHDFAVALLAKAVAQRDGAVKLHGLRMHQIRLLRYFGIDASAFRADDGRDEGDASDDGGRTPSAR